MRNLAIDPYGDRKRTTWNCTGTLDAESGKYVYTADPNAHGATLVPNPNSNTLPVGTRLVAVYTSDTPDDTSINFESCDERELWQDTDTGLWVLSQRVSVIGNHNLWLTKVSLTLYGVAIWREEDWPNLRALHDKGELPLLWSAPPRDTPTGVKAPAVLIP